MWDGEFEQARLLLLDLEQARNSARDKAAHGVRESAEGEIERLVSQHSETPQTSCKTVKTYQQYAAAPVETRQCSTETPLSKAEYEGRLRAKSREQVERVVRDVQRAENPLLLLALADAYAVNGAYLKAWRMWGLAVETNLSRCTNRYQAKREAEEVRERLDIMGEKVHLTVNVGDITTIAIDGILIPAAALTQLRLVVGEHQAVWKAESQTCLRTFTIAAGQSVDVKLVCENEYSPELGVR